MNTLEKISLKDRRVIIRVDFNVPLDENMQITDNTRIVAAIPTIMKVVNDGGTAIIISHLGRPKGKREKRFSLKPVVKELSKLLKINVLFCEKRIDVDAHKHLKNLSSERVVVLENIRFYNEETSGCINFAKKISELGDTYINDAFGTAHRKHASTALVARFFPKNKYLGFLFYKEISILKNVLQKPKRPLTAIVGGAKISGKIDVITALLDKVDNLIVGGGMAYTFSKAIGGNIGRSICEEDKVELAKKIISLAKIKNANLILPSDSLNTTSFEANFYTKISKLISIEDGYAGADIGPESISQFTAKINSSKTLIWNGPMGVFEKTFFETGTKKICEEICNATKRGAFSLVGGGDSVAALKKFNLMRGVSYVSTGGGAMLSFLEGKELPAVKAILD